MKHSILIGQELRFFIVRIIRILTSFDWLIFENIQGTLWYFCYLIFLGSQMIMTRMSHFFLSPTHANCVGGTYSYLWRHHDVSCLWYLLFKQIESRVWQINKYFTLGAVYLDALQVLGVIWSQGHLRSYDLKGKKVIRGQILSLLNIAFNSTQPKSGYSNEFSFLHLRDLIT